MSYARMSLRTPLSLTLLQAAGLCVGKIGASGRN